MANNEDTLIREVEEELRRERLQEIWNRYGTYVLLGAVAVVAAVGGGRFYQDRQAAAAAAAGSAFEKAVTLIEKSKPDEARAAFEELARNGPSGYAALARLQLAAAYAKAGDKTKATETYTALADDKRTDATLRSLAALHLSMSKVGDGAFTEVENRLNDLAADTSPWKSNARELIAVAQLKAGKVDKARAELEQILADQTAAASVRERAQILLAEIVAADLAKSATDAGAPAPAPAANAPAASAPQGQQGQK